jgi:hypothetical protein
VVHFTDTVVTLKDLASGRPFREFDHSRSGNTSAVTVRMPFDSEYGITLKTMDYGRRRMEVTIDGTEVADLIFQGGPGFQQTLERFMDSDKRFKFVKATNAAVADPTNPSNGDIVVKVWRENAPQPRPYTISSVHSGRCGFGGVLRGATAQRQFYGDAAMPTSGGITPDSHVGAPCSDGATVQGSPQVKSLNAGWMHESGSETLSMQCSFMAQQPAEEKGATVEGGTSSQTFGTTTWAGDLGEPSVFVFKLRAPVAPPVTRITAIYCSQCGYAGGPEARFCAACGSRLANVFITP